MDLVWKIYHSISQLCVIFHIYLLYQIQKSDFIFQFFINIENSDGIIKDILKILS